MDLNFDLPQPMDLNINMFIFSSPPQQIIKFSPCDFAHLPAALLLLFEMCSGRQTVGVKRQTIDARFVSTKIIQKVN